MTPIEQELRKEQLLFYKRKNLPWKFAKIAFLVIVIVAAILAIIVTQGCSRTGVIQPCGQPTAAQVQDIAKQQATERAAEREAWQRVWKGTTEGKKQRLP